MTAPLVEMRNISKRFGAIVALRQVSLAIGAGEVVGLVGDNAAGKSTLMKILSGVHTADAGEIVLDGRPRTFTSPMDARGAGIEMVYQDFALVPELSVTQNIFLGRELLQSGARSRFVDKPKMRERATHLIERLGLRVPPVDTPVRAISGGQQQAVAIARATAFDARLVIMDEPTANLAAAAIAKVRAAIGRMKSHGGRGRRHLAPHRGRPRDRGSGGRAQARERRRRAPHRGDAGRRAGAHDRGRSGPAGRGGVGWRGHRRRGPGAAAGSGVGAGGGVESGGGVEPGAGGGRSASP